METDLQTLKDKITVLNLQYRLGDPTVSDEEYDGLLENIKTMVSGDEYEKFVSTLNEGAIPNQGNKVKHKYIAGSLEKLKYDEPEKVYDFIHEFCNKTSNETLNVNVSAKVDGLSGILHYVKGRLVGASTRGDGFYGVDITDKAGFIKYIPKAFGGGAIPDDLYIRGEIVILRSDFDKFEGSAMRNIVAGVINRKTWNREDVMNLSFIAYTVMGPDMSKVEQFKFLEEHGFETVWHTTLDFAGWSGVAIADHLKGVASVEYPYETDGLVICDPSWTNEDEYRPKGCKAFKTNQNEAWTRLVDVVFQGPHKDGGFTPVGIVEPVDVSGAIVTKCTLNNLDFIAETGVKIGSSIKIIRSGEVIPKLIAAYDMEGSVEIQPPTECPSCGSKLVRDGVNMRCMNQNCPDQTTFQVMHFIRKLGVENAAFATLKNIGMSTIEKMVSWVPGKGKAEQNLYREINKNVFTKSQEDIFKALNFRGLADTLLSKIIDFYGFDNINKVAVDFIDPKDMMIELAKKGLPDGIGEIMLSKFCDSVVKNLNDTMLVCMNPRWNPEKKAEPETKKESRGTICFTGTLPSMGRNEASKLAEKAGFEVKSSVVKGLTYLVMADPNSNSTKAQKARKAGVKLIGEEEFLALVKETEVANVDEL
jgi:DNA ligase (NAD+)